MYFKLTMVSGNKKTGPIPTSMSAKSTCPSTCPLKGNGCYAELGPSNIYWKKISEGTDKNQLDADGFIRAVKGIRNGQLWRHNVAGDLPHDSITGNIDAGFLNALVKANKGKRGFTYTHHALNSHNILALKEANSGGFTVNVSANTLKESVQVFKETGLPTVTILPLDAPNVQQHDGVKVVACPAEKSDKVSCETCQMCQLSNRNWVIGFRAHGVSKKRVDIIARG